MLYVCCTCHAACVTRIARMLHVACLTDALCGMYVEQCLYVARAAVTFVVECQLDPRVCWLWRRCCSSRSFPTLPCMHMRVPQWHSLPCICECHWHRRSHVPSQKYSRAGTLRSGQGLASERSMHISVRDVSPMRVHACHTSTAFQHACLCPCLPMLAARGSALLMAVHIDLCQACTGYVLCTCTRHVSQTDMHIDLDPKSM